MIPFSTPRRGKEVIADDIEHALDPSLAACSRGAAAYAALALVA
jgi:hypothetical protein